MSAADAAISIPYTISFALGAAAVSVIGFRAIYYGEGIALLLTGLYFAWVAKTEDAPPELVLAEATDPAA